MTALTSDRLTSQRSIKYDLRPVAANAKGYKGGLAMCITANSSAGYFAPADSALTGVVVGKFAEDFDNTGGADGDVSANIEFSRERNIEVLNNDTGTPVTVAMREQRCYALDDQTVTGLAGTVGAGIVYDVDSNGQVHVEVDAEPAEGELAPGISATPPVDPTSSAASAGVASSAAAQDHKHHIALATPAAEGLMSSAYASAFSPVAANTTAIKAIGAAARADGMVVLDDSTGLLWVFNATSTASDTSENLVLTPGAGSGRWLLKPGQTVALSLAVTKDTTDNQTIFTTPTGARLKVREAWWDVSTSWTGGSSSAIGVHASPTGWSTKGDILGGASGDVLATLVGPSTGMVGTIGTKLDTLAHGRLLLEAADTLKFDRITSAFTAGAANVRVLVDVVKNAGA